MKWWRIVFLGMLLVSCSNSLEDQVYRLEKFVSFNQVGSGKDVWLVKHGIAGPHKVGLIFGFVSDYDFCLEIAEVYMKKYSASQYSCAFAN